VNWVAGAPPANGARVTARIRHRHREAPASLRPLPGARAHVTFDAPQTAVAPGQAVVFYDGDVVVGGGWIE
jgi:tRNA-specific 2-thiouridylase